MAPKGGPLDEKGPVITQILPSNLTDISNTNTEVIIHFDEFINPLSVVNTIEVLNFNEFNYQVRGKRIIINPISKIDYFFINNIYHILFNFYIRPFFAYLI